MNDQLAARLLMTERNVRVWSEDLPPGASQEIHTHENPYLTVVISSGSGETTDEDGRLVSTYEFAPGQVLYFGPEQLPVTHTLRNTGPSALQLLIIELVGAT